MPPYNEVFWAIMSGSCCFTCIVLFMMCSSMAFTFCSNINTIYQLDWMTDTLVAEKLDLK
ncbi:hypothetical protein C0995_001941 [Termitomyces sp. Mi166|nr:hypothetical protein C0995_001941 [Termitomyces sp. Mi166\